jgi:hypothetical protein
MYLKKLKVEIFACVTGASAEDNEDHALLTLMSASHSKDGEIAKYLTSTFSLIKHKTITIICQAVAYVALAFHSMFVFEVCTYRLPLGASVYTIVSTTKHFQSPM